MPYTRGAEESRPVDSVLAEAERLELDLEVGLVGLAAQEGAQAAGEGRRLGGAALHVRGRDVLGLLAADVVAALLAEVVVHPIPFLSFGNRSHVSRSSWRVVMFRWLRLSDGPRPPEPPPPDRVEFEA